MAPPLLHQAVQPTTAALPTNTDLWCEHVERTIGNLEARLDAMPASFEAAIRNVLADPKVTSDFWEKGFEELTKHASNGSSQWLGKRIMVAVVLGFTGWALVWLVKGGYIK